MVLLSVAAAAHTVVASFEDTVAGARVGRGLRYVDVRPDLPGVQVTVDVVEDASGVPGSVELRVRGRAGRVEVQIPFGPFPDTRVQAIQQSCGDTYVVLDDLVVSVTGARRNIPVLWYKDADPDGDGWPGAPIGMAAMCAEGGFPSATLYVGHSPPPPTAG